MKRLYAELAGGIALCRKWEDTDSSCLGAAANLATYFDWLSKHVVRLVGRWKNGQRLLYM